MNPRLWLMIGAFISGTAVGFGALGAHWFEGKAKVLYPDAPLQASGESDAAGGTAADRQNPLRERRQGNWETAAQYQIYHGLAILAAGFGALHAPMRRWSVAAGLFTVGALLFSGSLYAIALSGATELKSAPLGPLMIAATPIGGLCFLAGWAVFFAAALGLPRERKVG